MKYIFSVAVTLLLSGIAATAQTPLSIEQAIALGLQRNLLLQTARNNALPEALERAGEALVSRIANGY